MKKLMTMCAVVMMLFTVQAMALEYVETFDSDNAGWNATTIDDSGNVTYPSATWDSPGGNPDGFISGDLTTSGSRLYTLDMNYNTTPYGDMTGITLTVDFKLDGSVTSPEGAMVRFYIGRYSNGNKYYVSNDIFSWNPNDDTNWTTHKVQLDAANFIQWPNQVGGTDTFADVIADPEDMGLVFANGFTSNSTLGFSGTGTVQIDNFGTVPEPATIAILGMGAVGLIRRKRCA